MGRSGRRRSGAMVPVLLALLVAAALPPGAAGARPRWDWPLRPVPQVLAPAVLPSAPWLPGHRGVDLAAAAGDVVLAPADGAVAFAGTVVDRGVVTVAHDGGPRSSFEPVRSLVPVGSPVARGDPVAVVQGTGGHCGGRCLHWGVRRGQTYLDPLLLLRPPEPPVLLPLRPARSPVPAGLRWAV